MQHNENKQIQEKNATIAICILLWSSRLVEHRKNCNNSQITDKSVHQLETIVQCS